MRYGRLTLAALCSAFLTLGGCAAWPRNYGGPPCCTPKKVVVHKQPVSWHLFDVTVLSQLERGLDLIRIGRRLFGSPVRAFNLHHGEVADSTFFTNRAPESLTPEAVRWGPTRPQDPAHAPFVVTKPKIEGVTPGFFVTDARGVRYLFKLDPPDAPELLSGAEAVTSKLVYALGYHVPSYEIVTVRLADLRMGPGVTVKHAEGHPHPFTDEDLQRLLMPRAHGGVLRVVASKILEGDILGPARFKKFRDCAEMRALQVVFAWVNNIDTKDQQTLLVWDGTKTVGYLLDFGTSLGADAGRGGPKGPCAGATYIVDLKEDALELLTLGLYHPRCDWDNQPVDRSIGRLSPHVNPLAWKPYAPNLAFEEMDEQDAQWVARRMARLSHAQIEAAVSAGQYSNPADAAYLLEVLEQRRQEILHRVLGHEDHEDKEKPRA